jgi:head-tail adaptor
MPAGDYNKRFKWLKCTKALDATYGQQKESWADHGYLWGQLEELSGSTLLAYAARQAETTCRIKIRNYPPLSAFDRLVWLNQTYIIDGISRGTNELVVEAHRYEGNPY